MDGSQESPDEYSAEYQQIIVDISRENLFDLENLGCVSTGSDNDGNNVILLIPSVLFAHSKDYDTQLRRLLLLFIKKAHDLVQGPYTLVYAHTNLPVFSQQRIVYRIHKMLPRVYKKNLAKLYVVHPTFLIKAFFETAKWFISDKFYRKLCFLGSIAELQSVIPPQNIPLPAPFLSTEDAQKGLKYNRFMTPLHITFDSSLGTTPLIFQAAQFLRTSGDGLRTPGLFRLAGDQIEEDLVKTRLYGQPADVVSACIKIGPGDCCRASSPTVRSGLMSTVVITDIHTVASVLKMSLRDLQEPLICFSIYNALMQLAKRLDSDGLCKSAEDHEAICALLRTMPECHYATLQHLLSFLADVSQESAVNNMDTENLARIFAPTLLRSPGELSNDPMKAFAEVSLQKQLLHYLIATAAKTGREDGIDISSLKLSEKMMTRMQNRTVNYDDESVEGRGSESPSNFAVGKGEDSS